jgi:hypothetical protein
VGPGQWPAERRPFLESQVDVFRQTPSVPETVHLSPICALTVAAKRSTRVAGKYIMMGAIKLFDDLMLQLVVVAFVSVNNHLI